MAELHDITYWTVSRLETLAADALFDLARSAFRRLSLARLLLGRCLLAMKRTRACEGSGYSDAIHFCNLSGVEVREAAEARRVAERLEELPLLRTATEEGSVAWSQVREITRKASSATEALWLELARRCSYKQIEQIVASTPEGQPPAPPGGEAETSELRVVLPTEVMAMLQQVMRDLSQQQQRTVPMAQVLEILAARHLAGGTLTPATLEKLKAQARRDVQAALEWELLWWKAHPCGATGESSAPEAVCEFQCAGEAHPHGAASVREFDPHGAVRAFGSPEAAGCESPPHGMFQSSVPDSAACEAPPHGMFQSSVPDSAACEAHPDGGFQSSAPDRCASHPHGAARDCEVPDAVARESHPPGAACEPALLAPNEPDPSESAIHRTPAGHLPCGSSADRADPRPDPCQAASASGAPWQNRRLAWSGSARLVTDGQRRELLRRDGYRCSTPGCPNQLWLAVHHVVFFSAGGGTVPENLVTVCGACHRNIHQGLLRVHRNGRGQLEWTNRRGEPLGPATSA